MKRSNPGIYCVVMTVSVFVGQLSADPVPSGAAIDFAGSESYPVAGWMADFKLNAGDHTVPLHIYCWVQGDDLRLDFVDEHDNVRGVCFSRGCLLVDRNRPGSLLAVPDLGVRIDLGGSGPPFQFVVGSQTSFRLSLDGLVRNELLPTGEFETQSGDSTSAGETHVLSGGSTRDSGIVRVERINDGHAGIISIRHVIGTSACRDLFVELLDAGGVRESLHSELPGSDLWTDSVKSTAPVSDLSFRPMGGEWFDASDKYVMASSQLAQLVGHFDEFLVRLLEKCCRAESTDEYLNEALRFVKHAGRRCSQSRRMTPLKSGLIPRSVFRATVEARCGRRRVSTFVDSLIEVACSRNNRAHISKTLYILGRLGVRDDEFGRLIASPHVSQWGDALRALGRLSGVPMDVDAVRRRGDRRTVWEALLLVESEASLGQYCHKLSKLGEFNSLPLDQAERVRLLRLCMSVRHAREVLGQSRQKNTLQPFSSLEILRAVERSGLASRGVKGIDKIMLPVCLRVARRSDQQAALSDQIHAIGIMRQCSGGGQTAAQLVHELCSASSLRDRVVGVSCLATAGMQGEGVVNTISIAARSDQSEIARLAIKRAAYMLFAAPPDKGRGLRDVLLSGMRHRDRNVRLASLSGAVLVVERHPEQYRDIVVSAMETLGADSSVEEVQLAAQMVYLLSGRNDPWPPCAGEIRREPFESVYQWWKRNQGEIIGRLHALLLKDSA